jgi:hypothetical protein
VIRKIEGLHTDQAVALGLLTAGSGLAESTDVFFVGRGNSAPGTEGPGFLGVVIGIGFTIAKGVEGVGFVEVLGTTYTDFVLVQELDRNEEGHSLRKG